MKMTLHSRYGMPRRVGIFWFCGEGRKRSTFIGISRAWAGTAVTAGARKLDIGHQDGWAHAQRLSPALASFEFDHFPRGRLEWQQHTDQWRLYVDQKLLRGLFVTTVLLNWKPPKAQLVVLNDKQYRSRANIGLPALP
jgi:hypothetical protein